MPKYSLNLFLVWLVLVLAIPLCSANLGTFKQYDCISIRILANCSSINLTEVTTFNQTYVINKPMTNIGQTFNYTFCNTTNLGAYSYSWNNPCVDCSQSDCGNSFTVTVTGQDMTTAKAAAYTLIFIIAFLIFLGLLIVGISLPGDNQSDQMTGYVLAVSNLKYVKMFCLALSYLMAMLISYFSYMVCYSYLDMEFLTSLFRFMFYFLLATLLPFFIVMVYIVFANWTRDNKIHEALMRGIKITDG